MARKHEAWQDRLPIASLSTLCGQIPLGLICGVEGCGTRACVHCRNHDAAGDPGGGMYCAQHDRLVHHAPHLCVRESFTNGCWAFLPPDTCWSDDGQRTSCESRAARRRLIACQPGVTRRRRAATGVAVVPTARPRVCIFCSEVGSMQMLTDLVLKNFVFSFVTLPLGLVPNLHFPNFYCKRCWRYMFRLEDCTVRMGAAGDAAALGPAGVGEPLYDKATCLEFALGAAGFSPSSPDDPDILFDSSVVNWFHTSQYT